MNKSSLYYITKNAGLVRASTAAMPRVKAMVAFQQHLMKHPCATIETIRNGDVPAVITHRTTSPGVLYFPARDAAVKVTALIKGKRLIVLTETEAILLVT